MKTQPAKNILMLLCIIATFLCTFLLLTEQTSKATANVRNTAWQKAQTGTTGTKDSTGTRPPTGSTGHTGPTGVTGETGHSGPGQFDDKTPPKKKP